MFVIPSRPVIPNLFRNLFPASNWRMLKQVPYNCLAVLRKKIPKGFNQNSPVQPVPRLRGSAGNICSNKPNPEKGSIVALKKIAYIYKNLLIIIDMHKKHLFFSLILAVFCFSASAQSITELIKKYDNSQEYKNYNLLLIFDSTKVDVQETGLSYNNQHTLYKILTYKGAKKLSNLKFDYDPQSAFVEIKKVVVYKKDGTKKCLI